MSLLKLVLRDSDGRRAQCLPSESSPHDLSWNRAYRDMTIFLRENERWPSAYAEDTSEAFLGRWLNTQRTHYAQGTLRADRKESFSRLGEGWEGRRQRSWEDWLSDVEAFVAETGRWPKMSPKGAQEAQMGRWLSNQRSQYGRKELSEHRVDILLRTLGEHWVGRSNISRSWAEWLGELSQFRDAQNRFPSRLSDDLYEKKLAKWLERQLKRLKEGAMTQTEKEVMDQKAEGWTARRRGRPLKTGIAR